MLRITGWGVLGRLGYEAGQRGNVSRIAMHPKCHQAVLDLKTILKGIRNGMGNGLAKTGPEPVLQD